MNTAWISDDTKEVLIMPFSYENEMVDLLEWRDLII